jgi:lysophospholipase L1-like esterase
MQRSYTYLALGDSYTIGESVLLHQSFPYQLVQLLRKKGHACSAPEIIAKTGWTTSELISGMDGYDFLPKYDWVTLLIGVNNQFRGRSVEEYTTDFEKILEKAISLADKKTHVTVVSIPDYSVTPFGKEKEPERIAREIDLFNSINKALSIQYKVNYADITGGSREALHDPKLIAEDGLHPSSSEYRKWAEIVAPAIVEHLK